MHWALTYCIYIAFGLIIWIQIEMTFLRAVNWLHTLYMFLAIAILFVALLPQVRNLYKKKKFSHSSDDTDIGGIINR